VPGVEAYRGHREAASGVSPRRADPDEGRWWSLADFQRGAIRAADGRSLTEGEVQAHWWKRSLEEVGEHPLSEMRRGLLHLLSSFQADPLPRDVSTAYLLERTDRGGLAAVVWLTRILLPLGLIGFWIGRRNLSGPILVAGLSGLVAATLTYADPDSRLVTVAALAIGAGMFVHAMATGSRRARWTGLALVVPAVLLWGLWPARGGVPGMEVQAEDAFFLGALYDQEQRGSVAQREYDRALRMDPDNPLPRFALAGMLARDQLYERASEELERLVERHPRFYPGLLMLARLYEQQQRWPEGAQVYLGLLQLEPWNPELHNNYATLMVQMGLYEQATAALQTALRIDPDYTLARENLEGLRNMGLAPGTGAGGDPLRSAQEGVLARIREGNPAAAEDSLQAAYGRFGTIPSLVYLEGILRLSQGRPREAIDLFQPMYDERKSDPMFLNNLGSAYAEGGELEEARKVWEEALRLQPDNYRIQRNLLRIQAVMDSLEASPDD
jgi:tetratricopeptide (TPR) repeat protein